MAKRYGTKLTTDGTVLGLSYLLTPLLFPKDLPAYRDHDSVRFVCMGRGYLQPDSKTLEECQIPTFKTHPTPVNVSLRPDQKSPDDLKKKGHHDSTAVGNRTASIPPNATAVSQGCSCAIL
jgi:hypothetical protein